MRLLSFPRIAKRPDPAASYALKFAALSKCRAEIAQLETGAQLRIVEHLREVINERAQYEMRDMGDVP